MNAQSSSNNRPLNTLLAAILVIAWGAALGALPFTPARIVTHWGLDGTPDGYMGRVPGLLLAPAVATLLVVVLAYLPLIDPLGANYRAFAVPYKYIQIGLAAFLTAVELMVIAVALGYNLNVTTFITVLMSLLFIGLGSLLGKLQPNWFAGIRTPWTLASPEVWARTHRFGGRLMVVVGLITLAAGLLAPQPLKIIMLLIGIGGWAVASICYSYWVWRRLGPTG